jgi:hypothetical protein
MTTAVSLDLSPDAPHTPQRTAELAGRLAEIVRVLGEATKDGVAQDADRADGANDTNSANGTSGDRPAPGIGWPVAPEDLLDRLARLAEGTEELYPRLADALGRHHEAGTWRVAPVTGYARDLDEDLATVAEHLNEAATLAADVARHLYQARNLLSCVRPNYPRTDAATAHVAHKACLEQEPEPNLDQSQEPELVQGQELEQQRELDSRQEPAAEPEGGAEVAAAPDPSDALTTPLPAALSESAVASASTSTPAPSPTTTLPTKPAPPATDVPQATERVAVSRVAPVAPRPPTLAPHAAVISSAPAATAQAVGASAHE